MRKTSTSAMRGEFSPTITGAKERGEALEQKDAITRLKLT
jgi:hypothetical protein